MKKVLITGGAGFIGYHLAGYLAKKGNYEIHLIDNLSRGKIDDDLRQLINKYGIKFIKKNLTLVNSYSALDKNYDFIYHFSAIVGVRNVMNSPDKVLYTNIVSLLNLLEWIKKTQKDLKKLLFSSTSEVYAGTSRLHKINIPTDENVKLCLDDLGSSRTTYALSKIVGEAACLQYYKRHGIPAVIVRFHNVYGPRMGFDHVIPELMLKAKNSRKYIEVYSPAHTRAFCYISDAIDACVRLAENNKTSGKVFNIGNSSEEISIKSLAKKIANLINPSLMMKFLPSQQGSPQRRCPDTGKLKRTVRFSPKVSLKKGLKLTWQWYSKINVWEK